MKTDNRRKRERERTNKKDFKNSILIKYWYSLINFFLFRNFPGNSKKVGDTGDDGRWMMFVVVKVGERALLNAYGSFNNKTKNTTPLIK